MRAQQSWQVPERYNIARDVCDKHPRSSPAMIWEDWRGNERRVSWGELQDLSNQFANVLVGLGLGRGDRVATLLPSRPETAAVLLGTWKAGCILLSMSVLYAPDTISYRLRDSEAALLVTDVDNLEKVPDGWDGKLLVMGAGFEAQLARASTSHEMVDTAADDPAQLYYSSGTTGQAKGILHAHRYILAHEEYEFCHDLREGELFHGMGEWAWIAGICPLIGPWRHGAVQFVFARRGGFDPEQQLRVLSKHGVRNVFATPTAIRSMMSIEDAGTKYPQQFRIVCSAGEPLNPEAIRWFHDEFSVTPLDFYGLTESYPLCANFPTVEVRQGSMGHVMPGWDVAVLDDEEQPVPPDEQGEICLRARSNPHYPLGCWNSPEDSERVFGGAWFHTNDLARQDEDGYVWYVGRADDVIISAGYRIGPFEVESAIIEHEAALEAAVVASPDERRGHIVKAFIVLAPGYEPSPQLATEISGFVRDHHSAYAYPREVEFVSDLPKTLTGKIRRVELRQAEASRGKNDVRASQ